jgi:hypothetical protein
VRTAADLVWVPVFTYAAMRVLCGSGGVDSPFFLYNSAMHYRIINTVATQRFMSGLIHLAL